MKEITLYKHNKETYDKIIESWKTTNKVAVVQATGTGKSYIILKCLYDFINKKKVVLAPSTYILEQLEREGEGLDNTELITYSKLSFMNDCEIEQLNPSLIVLDEFHRCGAETWGNGINKLIKTFPNVKILGTSATNIRYLDNNRDMAEELFEGNVVTNLTLAEAIIDDILLMPKYVSALYTFDDEINNIKSKVKNSGNKDEDKEKILKEIEIMKNKLDISKGIPNILKKHLNNYNESKFLVFCKDVDHLNEMKQIVEDWFIKSKITTNINSYIAYSTYLNTDKEVNKFRLDNSRDTIKLLFSVDMFNEGVHIEDISGVILLRPTISPIIYYQQIGRAIQVGKNNNPIIFDFVNNFDNIGAKNFIGDLRECARIEKENNVSSNEMDNKNIDIFEFMIFDEIQEARFLFETIEEKLVDTWDFMYEELKNFYIKNGHCNVQLNDNYKLKMWIRFQRRSYKKNTLILDKIEKLEKINFSWDEQEESWEKMYEKLENFYTENGNCDVPKNCGDEKFYQWIKTQRNKYFKKVLHENRIEKLERLNFSWNTKEKAWNTMYKQLKEYFYKNGNIPIPKENKKLSLWVRAQRNSYELGTLNDYRIEKLKQINFSFGQKEEWDLMYSLLQEYKKEFGHCRVPSDYIYKNENLGGWVYNQRANAKNHKDGKKRIEQLNDIGFVWSEREIKWNIMYDCLQEYKNKYGDLNVPKDYMFDSTNLFCWIKEQRKSYKIGRISEERIEKLNNIGFQWVVYNK